MNTCGMALLSAVIASPAFAQNNPTGGVSTRPQQEVNFGASRAEQDSNPRDEVQPVLRDTGARVNTNTQAEPVINPGQQNVDINANTQTKAKANTNRDMNNDGQNDDQIGIQLDQSANNQLVVKDVAQNSPAARMGLRQGDHIIQYNNRSFDNADAFHQALVNTPRDSQVTIVYERGGQRYTRNAWLGQPQQTFDPNSRVMVQQQNQNYDNQYTAMKPVGDNLVPMTAGTTGYVQSGCGCNAAPAPVYSGCGCSAPAVVSDCGCNSGHYGHYRHHRRHRRNACCW